MSGKGVCYKFGHLGIMVLCIYILYMYTIICSGVSPLLCLSTSVMVHLYFIIKASFQGWAKEWPGMV